MLRVDWAGIGQAGSAQIELDWQIEWDGASGFGCTTTIPAPRKNSFYDMMSTSTIWRCTVMVTLEKNIEIPEKQKIAKYPYEALELGDSFYVQDGDLGRLCNANYREWRKSGKKFTARKVEGGVRVWRVE